MVVLISAGSGNVSKHGLKPASAVNGDCAGSLPVPRRRRFGLEGGGWAKCGVKTAMHKMLKSGPASQNPLSIAASFEQGENYFENLPLTREATTK